MPCYAIDGVVPVVSPDAYVHPTAVIIGDVVIEAGVYIGPLASLRADFGGIRIKKNANIQDNCIIHGFPNHVVVVEEYGHIGHAAILHGCIVRKNALVGMNSVILDLAEVGENSIIGANSTVKAKMVIPSNVMALGSPAKVIRALTEKELAWKVHGTRQYIDLAKRALGFLEEVQPLTADTDERLTHKQFTAQHHIKSEF